MSLTHPNANINSALVSTDSQTASSSTSSSSLAAAAAAAASAAREDQPPPIRPREAPEVPPAPTEGTPSVVTSPSAPDAVIAYILRRMLDESHMGVNLWLRSVGLRNPFFDDDDFSDNSSDHSSSPSSRNSSRSSRHRNNNDRANSGGGAEGGYYHPRQGDTNDVMVPPEDAESRQGTVWTSSTALALTLAGSCAVEAPYAFQKCGLLWGTLLFGGLAVATERSLHMLCICARKTGSNSYGTLARSACGGSRAQWKTNALEIGLLLLLVARYLTLLRRVLALGLQSVWDTSSPALSEQWVLLICVLVVVLPLSSPKQYYTLRHAWALGLGTMALFAAAVLALAIIHFYEHDGNLQQDHDRTTATTMETASQDHREVSGPFTSPRSAWDVIEGFQTLLIGFFTAFNVLPIQSALENPTRERMATVVHHGVLMGATLTYIVGVVGYLCVGAHVASSSCPDSDFWECVHYRADNIHEIPYILLYRIGHTSCSITIILALPLIVTPCRHCILELVESIYTERQCPEISDCQEDCETCTTRASTTISDNSQNPSNALVVVDERTGEIVNEASQLLPSIEENPTYDLLSNPLAQGISTFCILMWAYSCAVVVTLVDDFYVWVGPCLVYIFAFMLPSMHFFTLQRPNRPASTDPEKKSFRLFARILIFFCMGGIVCSLVDIVYNLPGRHD